VIGIFGVGGKRAAIALGVRLVPIGTRGLVAWDRS